MDNLKNWTDDQLFSGASEQPGSQFAYYREIETRRRLYELQRRQATAAIEATDAQVAAAAAAEKTAVWTRASAIAIALSVIVMAIAAVI